MSLLLLFLDFQRVTLKHDKIPAKQFISVLSALLNLPQEYHCPNHGHTYSSETKQNYQLVRKLPLQ